MLSIDLPIGDNDGQRTMCFFDERIPCSVVCLGPVLETALIIVDVSVLPSDHVDNQKELQGLFSIYETVLTEPISKNGQIVFPFEFTMSYPRTKFELPMVMISARLDEQEEVVPPDSHLENFEPKNPNLLAELNHQVLTTNDFHLLDQLSLVKQTRAKTHHLTQVILPVKVSLLLKLRTMKAAGRNQMVLAALTLALDLEGSMCIEVVDMKVEFKHGLVSRIHPQPFPLRFGAGDFMTSTYKLINEEEVDAKHITINLTLRVHLKDGRVSNDICTSWTPLIDFCIIAPPINHSLRTAGKKKVRPKKVNTVTVNLSLNNILAGLRLTFTGALTIGLGEVVNWQLQAINNSNQRLTLSLMVQTKPTLVSVGVDPEAVDPNQLAVAYLAPLSQPGVLILDNGLRITLEPNAVYETSIRLFGVTKGTHTLEGLKVFDVNSGEGLDLGKLIEVFVI